MGHVRLCVRHEVKRMGPKPIQLDAGQLQSRRPQILFPSRRQYGLSGTFSVDRSAGAAGHEMAQYRLSSRCGLAAPNRLAYRIWPKLEPDLNPYFPYPSTQPLDIKIGKRTFFPIV